MIHLIQLGILILDDLAHPELSQLFWHQLGIEKPAFDRCLVLHKCGDDLVEVLLADTLRFLALRRDEAFDLDLEPPRLLAEANTAGS